MLGLCATIAAHNSSTITKTNKRTKWLKKALFLDVLLTPRHKLICEGEASLVYSVCILVLLCIKIMYYTPNITRILRENRI